MIYEYKIIRADEFGVEADSYAGDSLNDLAAEGWEPVMFQSAYTGEAMYDEGGNAQHRIVHVVMLRRTVDP